MQIVNLGTHRRNVLGGLKQDKIKFSEKDNVITIERENMTSAFYDAIGRHLVCIKAIDAVKEIIDQSDEKPTRCVEDITADIFKIYHSQLISLATSSTISFQINFSETENLDFEKYLKFNTSALKKDIYQLFYSQLDQLFEIFYPEESLDYSSLKTELTKYEAPIVETLYVFIKGGQYMIIDDADGDYTIDAVPDSIVKKFPVVGVDLSSFLITIATMFKTKRLIFMKNTDPQLPQRIMDIAGDDEPLLFTIFTSEKSNPKQK